MFTGIITAVGSGARRRVATEVASSSSSTRRGPTSVQGESIAVDGACLTVSAMSPGGVRGARHRDVARTGRGSARYAAGRRVNLERALRVGDRLGGHLVQGHVDGVGTVLGVSAERDDARLLDIEVPPTRCRACRSRSGRSPSTA